MQPDGEREPETPKQDAAEAEPVKPVVPVVPHLETEIEPPTQSLNADAMPASDPESEPTPAPTSTPKPKKRKRGLLLIILLLLLLVGGGVAAYMVMYAPKEKEVTKTSTDTKQAAPKESAAKLLVEEIKAEISGQDVTSDAQFPPAYKPSSYEFYVYPATTYAVDRTGSKSVVEDSLASIRDLLNEKGYTEDIKQAGDDTSMFIAYATGDEVLCYVYDMKPASPSPTDIRFQTGVSCADKTSYTETAKELKPYVDVYAEKSEEDVSNSLFNSLKTEKSSVSGYARATLGVSGANFDSVGGFAALFYQTPDKEWHFFIGTQNIVPCSDYNSIDLKKAYLGESCYDAEANNEEATVTL